VSERQKSLVMLERDIESYGKGIPYLPNTKVNGRLTVIEGPDASDRNTQITMLTSILEADGHAVLNTGLRRYFCKAIVYSSNALRAINNI